LSEGYGHFLTKILSTKKSYFLELSNLLFSFYTSVTLSLNIPLFHAARLIFVMVAVSSIMYQDMKKLQLLKISLVGTWVE